ncbi:hypothetical protein Pan153_58300 [Gimesia panareensis]|uniref:HD-GYP domain-containing protein n=1 Tax=Gimesia panareensis TaxID=2527978 RepID=A0A518FXP0_9PLAN|nr:hypothetical protein Pan153_58300 [Gimesia panareensis]
MPVVRGADKKQRRAPVVLRILSRHATNTLSQGHIVNHSTRSLRWLTPTIRRERNEWEAFCARINDGKLLESSATSLRALKDQFRELEQQNRELKISELHQELKQLQARVNVILQRCRLYLDTTAVRSLCETQLPHLERILDFVHTEQIYLRRQLLLSQTTVHYLKQLLTAAEDIWTQSYCNPNYLLNLIRKIKHDDAHLNDPGDLLFLSLRDMEAVAQNQISHPDLGIYLRGLEVARCSYYVSRQIPEWRESCDLLMMAGMLHDLGWLMLNPKLANKADGKDAQRNDERGEHPILGAALLGGLRGFPGDSYLTEVVAQHHERLDGTGYPRRLHTYHLGEHSRRMGVICRYLELKNDRCELTADGIRTCDGEELAFGAALQLYRETLQGEWDPTVADQLFRALDANLPEELRESDRHNDPFSLKRFQSYRPDEAHAEMTPPHFSLERESRSNRSVTDHQTEK